jgi:hypothetical protein
LDLLDSDKDTESNDTYTDDDEISYNNHRINGTLSGDESEEEKEDFTFEHEDL